MSSQPLIPPTFFFRLAIDCRRLDRMPRNGSAGGLLSLPESCRVPDFARIDGRTSWAEVRVAWNPAGLGVSVETSGKTGPIVSNPRTPETSDSAQFWVDTRDTRDVHRATRYCHRFAAILAAKGAKGLDSQVEQCPINRALASPPPVRESEIARRADRTRTGWILEVFFPASSLHGFDPETNRRLGFYYQVTDPARGDQYLSVGREFPIAEDPSLWATLELTDQPA